MEIWKVICRIFGITLNNKLVELQHQFQNAGISMYSQKVEDYGTFKRNYVGSSFVGDAIIADLIGFASRGTQNLADYDKEKKKLTDKKVEQVQGLEKASPIRKFFGKIRNFFMPIKQEDISYTQEETEAVNTHLSEYRETDNQLWKYNLRDNVVASLVKQIRERGYHAFDIPGLLEECVILDLEKLGLGDLILQLQQALIEEYKKDLPDPEIYQVKQEDLYLYVPDFTRRTQDAEEVDFEELHRQENTVIDESKKTLKNVRRCLRQNGIELTDFYSVDKTVSASERQTATSAIGEELHPVEKKENKDLIQESEDKSLDD